MTELICITCPKGCHLRVDEAHGYTVTGNSCPRGEAYGRQELLHPVRIVTSTVKLESGSLPRLPVKTDRPIPKEKVPACMELIHSLRIQAPVQVGAILASHILGTDANLVATMTVKSPVG